MRVPSVIESVTFSSVAVLAQHFSPVLYIGVHILRQMPPENNIFGVITKKRVSKRPSALQILCHLGCTAELIPGDHSRVPLSVMNHLVGVKGSSDPQSWALLPYLNSYCVQAERNDFDGSRVDKIRSATFGKFMTHFVYNANKPTGTKSAAAGSSKVHRNSSRPLRSPQTWRYTLTDSCK